MNYNFLVAHPLDSRGWLGTPLGQPSPHLVSYHPDTLILTFGYPLELAKTVNMCSLSTNIHSDVHALHYHPGLNGHPALPGAISLPRALDRLAQPEHLLPLDTWGPLADQLGPKVAEYWSHIFSPILEAFKDISLDLRVCLQRQLFKTLPTDVYLTKASLTSLLSHPDRELRLRAAVRLGRQPHFPDSFSPI